MKKYLRQITITIFASFFVCVSVYAVTSYTSVYNSSDGGMIYGEIYIHESASTTAVNTQDTPVQVLNFFFNGESNGVTPDHTNDHLTALTAGVYKATMSFSFSSSNSNDYQFHLGKNNNATEYNECHTNRTPSAGGSSGAASMQCIIMLNANDTVEFWVERGNGGAVSRNITIENASLSIIKIND